MIPQIICLLLLGLGYGVLIANHGQKKTGLYKFNLLGVVLIQLLIWWGGFWDNGFHWPHIAHIFILAIDFGWRLTKFNKPMLGTVNAFRYIPNSIGYLAILYFGGFFKPFFE